MNPNELEAGDYIEVSISESDRIQLAKILAIDKVEKKALILIQSEKNPRQITTKEQWESIFPHSIFCQDLHALGFNETSLEIAYGWTGKDWTKISLPHQTIYNLSYEDNSWRVEIIRMEGMRQYSRLVEGIQYIHELQYLLKLYTS